MDITPQTLQQLRQTASGVEKQLRTLVKFYSRRWRAITPAIVDPTIDHGPQHFMEQTAQIFNNCVTRYSVLVTVFNSMQDDLFLSGESQRMPPEIRSFLTNAEGFLDFWNPQAQPFSAAATKNSEVVKKFLAYLERPESPEFLEVAKLAPTRGQTWEELQAAEMQTTKEAVEHALTTCAGGVAIDIQHANMDTAKLVVEHNRFQAQLAGLVEALRARFPEEKIQR